MNGILVISLAAAAAAFGAVGAVVGLVGLGLPFLVASLAASALAGMVVNAVARRAIRPPQPDPALLARIQDLLARGSALRHDIRGVLSPALMMADRLLQSEDPKIRRAGEAVVRSVERTTALLAEDKQADTGPTATAPDPAAGARQ